MAFNLAQGNLLGTMLELFLFGDKSLGRLHGVFSLTVLHRRVRGVVPATYASVVEAA
jgi:hypothetical protein